VVNPKATRVVTFRTFSITRVLVHSGLIRRIKHDGLASHSWGGEGRGGGVQIPPVD